MLKTRCDCYYFIHHGIRGKRYILGKYGYHSVPRNVY